MGKHKDKFYRGLLTTSTFAFLRGRLYRKICQTPLSNNSSRAITAKCGHGMTPSESPLATARTEILSGKLSKGTLLLMMWPELSGTKVRLMRKSLQQSASALGSAVARR